MSLTLFHMAHSPWSQKTRCALAHHNLPVETVEYRPFIDEPALRLRLLRRGAPWAGRVAVPVLFAPDHTAVGSWDIARHAEALGSGPPLIPERDTEAIAAWNAQSDRLLDAGRARFMIRAMREQATAREVVPPALANAPTFLLQGSLRLFMAKYGIAEKDYQVHGERLRAELASLRQSLADGRAYLTGTLSYADFAIAVALQTVDSLPGSSFGPHSAHTAREPELAEEFGDLLRWRDGLQGKHDLARIFRESAVVSRGDSASEELAATDRMPPVFCEGAERAVKSKTG